MIRAMIAALSCALATLAISARADPYDECILTHFSASQDRSALNEIERACLNSTVMDIPPDMGALKIQPHVPDGPINSNSRLKSDFDATANLSVTARSIQAAMTGRVPTALSFDVTTV
jgi:hypothetical protein